MRPLAAVLTTNSALDHWLRVELGHDFRVSVAPPQLGDEVSLVVVDEPYFRDLMSDGARGLTRHGDDPPSVLAMVRSGDRARVAMLLEAGADDAVREPFVAAEVRARARALVRRAQPRPRSQLRYDRARREIVREDGSRRRLTASEIVLLETLIEARGQVVERAELLGRASARPLALGSNAVDRHIARLRSKLGDDPRSQRWVSTMPGRGYRLVT